MFITMVDITIVLCKIHFVCHTQQTKCILQRTMIILSVVREF